MTDNNLCQYSGNCHCAAFRFTVTTAEPLVRATTCNCSICFKKGYLYLKLEPQQLCFTRGSEDGLSSYTFGERLREHLFCPICGTAVIVKKKEEKWINVRALGDVKLWNLGLDEFEGGKLPPKYTPPRFQGVLPAVKGKEKEQSTRTYTGGCHCGAVTLALRSKPLVEIEVKEDNCSICRRNANVCIYLHKSQLTLSGNKNMTEYLFGGRSNGHCFCKICGVPVFMNLRGPPEELAKSWTEKRQEMVGRKLEIVPLRVRVLELDDGEWEGLKVERCDEGTEGYVID